MAYSRQAGLPLPEYVDSSLGYGSGSGSGSVHNSRSRLGSFISSRQQQQQQQPQRQCGGWWQEVQWRLRANTPPGQHCRVCNTSRNGHKATANAYQEQSGASVFCAASHSCTCCCHRTCLALLPCAWRS